MFFNRVHYELQGPWTWDTPIYWAIGRGIYNHIQPYSGLFETKPPGIFLLATLSLLIAGNVDFMRYFQITAIGIIAVAPIFAFLITNPRRQVHWGLRSLISLSFGLVLGLYSAQRSGEIQVESFGAAFGCLYAVTCYYLASRPVRPVHVLVCSGVIFFACLLKEPFALSCLGVSLVFISCCKKFVQLFVLPLALAGALGLLTLYFVADVKFYLTEYLPYMSSAHVGRFGSPWIRALNFRRTLEDQFDFSFFFGLIISLIALGTVWTLGQASIANGIKKFRGFGLLRLFLVFFLPSLAVGLGGEYYNHHFVFAVPNLLSWFLLFLNSVVGKKSSIIPLATISMALIYLAPYQVSPNYQQDLAFLKRLEMETKDEAKYLDEILKMSETERYLFIGFNGPQVYGWTSHSPLGPLFCQNPDWLRVPEFRTSFLANLSNAKIIVVSNLAEVGDLRPTVEKILESEFTETPWKTVSKIKRDQNTVKIYFRLI